MIPASQRIVVTGATGFIGRRVIERLCQIYDPSTITCLVYEKCDSALEISGREVLRRLQVKTIAVDVETGHGLDQVPRPPNLVVHLAAKTDTSDPDHRINDIGTKNLYESLTPWPATARFVYASTIAVCDHRQDRQNHANETSLLLGPRTEYGRKKLATEKYLRQVCRRDGVDLWIIRVPGVYGPDTRPQGLFDLVKRLARTGSLVSRLNFPGRIGVLHVEDMADVFVRAATSQNGPETLPRLIVAGHEVLSIADMFQAAYQALGKTHRPVMIQPFLWTCLRALILALLPLEPLLPHRLHNRLWQLSLVVSDAFANKSLVLTKLLEGKAYRNFSQAMAEELGVHSGTSGS